MHNDLMDLTGGVDFSHTVQKSVPALYQISVDGKHYAIKEVVGSNQRQLLVWKKRDSAQEPKTETDINTVESLRFDLSALEEATNKFSEANKLGEGGFGEVYKISRLLANLPHFGVALMTADRKVGLTSSSVFPHLVTQDAGTQTSIDSFYEYLLKAYLLFGDEEYL
ncbi:hypothetical protein P8452_21726 [Trifolium repens]|nr:hypothetical protein P8452_00670 [Trifolium repens]WJX33525.1 hypothetical protein P8452_21726 [Trifolium repens]